MSNPMILHVPQGEKMRLDVFLAQELADHSRNEVQAWCKQGLVAVGEQNRKGSFTVHGGDAIRVLVPQSKPVSSLVPEELPLDIVHEDDSIIVVNKAQGMVVHPGAGVSSGTLAQGLAFRFQNLSKAGGEQRPGIVHRLDRGTSGLILVAKTDAAHRYLSQQWQDGAVTKVYQTLVWGKPASAEGRIQTHIGRHPKYRQLMAAEVPRGKWADSRYKTVAAFPEASKLNVHILTGRTHQIRVHLAHIGHPVVGDALYGKNRHKNLAKSFAQMPEYPMLHAGLLRFSHPETKQLTTFKLSPPAAFLLCEKHLETWPNSPV